MNQLKLFLIGAGLSLLFATGLAQSKKIISVADFGALANSGRDVSKAIQRALQACKETGAGELFFPQGRYDFYPDSAAREEYFISNTSSEEECPSKIKTIGILLKHLNRLTIQGNGSHFIFHGKMTTLAADHCSDIRFLNFTVDFARPTMSEFTVIHSSDTSIEVRVHPDSWYRIENGKLVWYGEGWTSQHFHCIKVDPLTGFYRYANAEYGWLQKAVVRENGPQQLIFSGHFPVGSFVPGTVFTVRDPIRDEVGAYIGYSRNILFDRVNMRYMHGLGIVCQFTENIRMKEVEVAPDPSSGRIMASFADAMHFSGCRGLITIEDCRFKGMHDDPVNVHGTHLKIMAIPASNEIVLRFMHGQSYGFQAFFPGDSLAFIDPVSLTQKGFSIAGKVVPLSEREVRVILSEAVPAEVHTGDVVENISWTPSLLVRNCLFTGSNTRGLLVTTRRPVVIENNRFENLGMAAILIADDARSWYESGPVRNVLIRHNRFIDCGYNSSPGSYSISIEPQNDPPYAVPVHRDIRIDKNYFRCLGSPVLRARSVQGLSFTRNRMETAKSGGESADSLPSLLLNACRQVILSKNRFVHDLPGRTLQLEFMKPADIRLQQNHPPLKGASGPPGQ